MTAYFFNQHLRKRFMLMINYNLYDLKYGNHPEKYFELLIWNVICRCIIKFYTQNFINIFIGIAKAGTHLFILIVHMELYMKMIY